MNGKGERGVKLLFIGLDGLSFDTFMAHEMPFLHGLVKEGLCARLISFEEPYMSTGPVWTSIQTGLAPEGHGVQGISAANWHTAAFKDGVKTIWRMLNEKGVRCGLVNFPVTYPLRPVDSFVVCGFPAPWEYQGAANPWPKVDRQGALFWPDELAAHIGTFRSAWMNYITPDEFEDTHEPYRDACDGDAKAQRYLMALLCRSLHETAGLAFRLMASYQVDLMATVFMETDVVGHLGGALPKAGRAALLRDVDETVAEVVAAARPETVMVMSDHGCWGDRHTREGVFLAAGPAFASGLGGSIEVLEVAPTVLYLFGAYAPQMAKEPAYRLLASAQVGEAQQRQITERLRALGYLD